MNPDGPHHKEDHLHLGIKIYFLDIVILVEVLDTRQSIVESMKGIIMQDTLMVKIVDMEMLVDLSTEIIIHLTH
jgi:hypothetical protein